MMKLEWNPDLAALLVSGGDSRITPDPLSGRNKYGCLATPDVGLLELGSSTASSISVRGWRAAERCWLDCQQALELGTEAEVYRQALAALRADLRRLCGGRPDDGSEILMAASGTDIHLLLGQLLQPDLTVMISNDETGSGLAAALQGRHFSSDSTCVGGSPEGDCVGQWRGRLQCFAARNSAGRVIDASQTAAAVRSEVERAAATGQTVLCILTDVSKTGLMFPDVQTLFELQRRFPEQVWLLVDGCQFRLAPATIQAYLAESCMVALTGSKFLGGPTFSGALLMPAGIAAALRPRQLAEGVRAYSLAADWPDGFSAVADLHDGANFGLLLRWKAALAELEMLSLQDPLTVGAFLRDFGLAVQQRLSSDAHFQNLPVAPLQRGFADSASWDLQQSIFPFLLFITRNRQPTSPLSRAQSLALYQALQAEQADASVLRYQLGQPVLCGEYQGVPVSALRLCVSAPMICDALSAPERRDFWIAAALAALDQLALRIDQLAQL